MVDRALLFEQLMATFIDELGERVRTINDDLLILEKNKSIEEQTEALVRLFRAAHSIKGASRAVEQFPLEQICHEFEEVLVAIRDHKIESSADMFSVLFSVADAMEAAGMQLRERNTLDTDALDLLIVDLRRVVCGADAQTQSAVKSEDPKSKDRKPKRESSRRPRAIPKNRRLRPGTASPSRTASPLGKTNPLGKRSPRCRRRRRRPNRPKSNQKPLVANEQLYLGPFALVKKSSTHCWPKRVSCWSLANASRVDPMI